MTFKQFRNKRFVRIITNRYVLILSIFFVWMLFFDENSILNHIDFNREINKLNKEKEYFKTEIQKDTSLIEKLKDKEELEKYAREQYHMKKENEEIFLIEYDTLPKK